METLQGVRTKVILVSSTHGAIRIPLEQSLNYTPRLTERTINEFDNLEAAAVVTSFDGVDITFDYLDSDSKLVDASFADVDPAADIIIDDPSDYKKVTLFANVTGLESGKIFASVLAKQCRAKGSPYTEPVKEEAAITRDLSGINTIKLKGVAILYSRILAASPAGSVYDQVIPPNAYVDVNFNGGGVYTLPKTAIQVFAGKYYLYVLKNGVEADPADFTITSSTVTLDSPPATTDVWEVFTAYVDA